MPKYLVAVSVRGTEYYEVEADTEWDALELWDTGTHAGDGRIEYDAIEAEEVDD